MRDRLALGGLIGMAWKSVPFMVLIVVGAFSSIPRDVLSASRTLGAGAWQTFTRVQIPLALPTAYALARIPFRAKRAIELFILAPLIVPGIIIAIGLGTLFCGWAWRTA